MSAGLPICKVIVVGDGAVGKSSITIRTCFGRFDAAYIMTIGVDFGIKTCEIDDVSMKMQIWDTAGQERFHFLLGTYYKGAHGALIVYDITRSSSYENIPMWMENIVKNIGKPIPTILIGNKSDLQILRDVPPDAGPKMAKTLSTKYGLEIPFCETSAKTNENVEIVFLELGRMMLQDLQKEAKKVEEWKERAKVDWW